MINFLKQLLDYIYKEQCYLCRRTVEDVTICSKCYKEILQNEANHAYTIEIKDGVPYYWAGFYSKNLQKIIRGLKYHGQKRLAPVLAKFLYLYWKKFDAAKENYVIVPVPLYKTRQKKRKYNHMLLVADEFAKITGYSINNEIIARIKDTKPQYGLKKSERTQNMQDAFCVKTDLDKDKKLLIIDDILTTGATVREMIKTLRSAGYNNITVLTITSHLSRK